MRLVFEALSISPEELAKMLHETANRSLRNGGCLEIAVSYFVDSVGLKRAIELLGEDLAFSARSDDLWHALRPWMYLDPDGTLSIVSRAPYEFLRDFLDWLADDVAWTGRFKTLADLAKKLDPEHDGNVGEDVADSVSSVLVVLRRVRGIEEFVEKWLWLDPVPVLSNAIAFADIVGGYTDELVELFERFVSRGGDVEDAVWSVVSGLCRWGALGKLVDFVDRVRELAPNYTLKVVRKIPYCYSIHGRLEDALRYAEQLGDNMIEVAVKLYVASKTSVVEKLSRELEEKTLNVLKRVASMLQSSEVELEYTPYVGLIVESLAKLGYVDEVLWLAESGKKNEPWILTDVIIGLVERGDLKRALEILEQYWYDFAVPLAELVTIAAKAVEVGDEEVVQNALIL